MESNIRRIRLEPGCSRRACCERLPLEGGTYVLSLQLACEAEMRIGELGTFAFASGWYAYVGSARGGLRARLERHLRARKALRWHIDYLLARAELGDIWYVVSPERLECRWAQSLAGLPGAAIPVRRFGASDCRCPAHLVYWPEAPAPEAVARAILGTESSWRSGDASREPVDGHRGESWPAQHDRLRLWKASMQPQTLCDAPRTVVNWDARAAQAARERS